MGSYVCLNCCDINFDAYFGLSPDHPSIPSISLKDALASVESCPFCDLLVTAASQLSGRNQIIPYRAWPQSTSDNQRLVFYFEREYRQPVRGEGNIHIRGGGVMKVKLYPPPFPLLGDSLMFKICPIFTCPTEQLADLQHSARFVAEDQIDLALCRQWLQDCEVHHPEICRDYSMLERREQVLPSGFRLIDVVNQCISQQPLTSRYISLSYVWGQVETLQLRLSNVADLEAKHSLRGHKSEIAQTILDAMEVVRTMGEKYLWVDCLCIIQDAPDLDLQIGCMDRIYGGAIVSIVASTGGDANVGLAGVRSGSRIISQLTREVWPDLELVVSLPTPNELTSPWESRGWAFQEQMLSRRFLIFREGQVIWQCSSQSLCEDTCAMNKIRPFQRLRQIAKSWPDEGAKSQQSNAILIQPEPLHRPNAFVEYISIVAEYTQKQLRYPNDILRAFEGLSRILETYFQSQFISGLPETYLDAALLWMPQTVLERRLGLNNKFPSWSWTGWMGGTCFEDVADLRLEKIVPLIKWYHKEGNSQAILVNTIGIGIDETNFGSAKSVNTCLWFPLFEALADQIGSLPEIDLPDDKHLYLQFWTSCAFLKITPNQNIARDAVENSMTGRKLRRFLIRSSRNQVIGYLTMDGVQPYETRLNHHEFIVVSVAQVSGFNPVTWAIQYSENCLMYNVLLVEWDYNHRVAQRVGIGRVLKGAWKEAGSCIKFVTLG